MKIIEKVKNRTPQNGNSKNCKKKKKETSFIISGLVFETGFGPNRVSDPTEIASFESPANSFVH